MPIQSKISTTWEHAFTTKDGIILTANGKQGGESVRISVYEPPTGYGLSETPGGHAGITVPWTDWIEFVNLIGGRK